MIHDYSIPAAATLVIASLTSWITKEDWDRLVGPWGGFLVSIILCALLLRHSAKRIKKEDERTAKDNEERERRHKESMEKQDHIAKRFEKITDGVNATNLEVAKVLLKLNNSCENLHYEMRSRPCQRMTANTELPE